MPALPPQPRHRVDPGLDAPSTGTSATTRASSPRACRTRATSSSTTRAAPRTARARPTTRHAPSSPPASSFCGMPRARPAALGADMRARARRPGDSPRSQRTTPSYPPTGRAQTARLIEVRPRERLLRLAASRAAAPTAVRAQPLSARERARPRRLPAERYAGRSRPVASAARLLGDDLGQTATISQMDRQGVIVKVVRDEPHAPALVRRAAARPARRPPRTVRVVGSDGDVTRAAARRRPRPHRRETRRAAPRHRQSHAGAPPRMWRRRSAA